MKFKKKQYAPLSHSLLVKAIQDKLAFSSILMDSRYKVCFFKGAVMQTEKALITDRLCVSKVS